MRMHTGIRQVETFSQRNFVLRTLILKAPLFVQR